MTFRGKVTGGVVVFDGGVAPPEGTRVTIVAQSVPARAAECDDPLDDPIYRIAELAQPTGVPDLALNLDHYLYGHPKRGDE